LDPIAYYNPEMLLFLALAQSFADTGTLDPVALYLILDWKAPRARDTAPLPTRRNCWEL
jgi:hypothetical protein